MVTKFNTTVEFCGKKRKFTRVPNKALRDYQKTMDDIQEKLVPLAERQRDYQFKISELDDEIGSIDKHIELLEKLEDPSDSEIRECIELTKTRLSIQKEIHDIRVENDKLELQDKEFYDELEEELRNSYGEFASLIFTEFDPSEMDEADSTDLTIAPRLGDLYRLALTGAKQKEIDKLYKSIITDSFR